MKKLINLICFIAVFYSGSTLAQCSGCPTVDAQVATGPSTNICLGQSVVLSASNTAILGANTSSYTVSSIAYAPQPYLGGAVAVQNVDDGWGAVQTSPFTICYYGNQYTQFVVGSNGVLTFNLGVAGGYCPWPINAAWPSLANIVSPNDIGVPYRDITMSGGYSARWYVSGTAPFRTLVIYWDNVPYFSCGSPGGLGSSLQLILYESTHVIEVHIMRSVACASWNNGAGIVGIQTTPNPGLIAPARNFPGAWTANNEAWRFSPMPTSPSYTWFGPGGPVGTGTTITVTPSVTTTYSAQCLQGCPPGTVQVIVNSAPALNVTNNSPICEGGTINLMAGAGGANTTYSWTGPGSFVSSVQNPMIASGQQTNSGIYYLTAANNFPGGASCVSSGSTNVSVVPVNQTTVTSSFTLCQGDNLNLTATNSTPPSGYLWTGPAGFSSTLQNPSIPNVLPNVAGDYTVTAAFVVPGVSLACTSTAVTNVSIVATSPVTVSLPNNICERFTANLTATTNPPALQYIWAGPNGFGATGSSTSIPNIPAAGTGMYSVTAVWAIGTKSCTIGGSDQINVVPVGDVTINDPVSVCVPANVTLTASSPGAIAYSWTASSGFTSNLANNLITSPSPSISGMYTVTTAYTNGALICFNSNTTSVMVNPILPFTLPPYKQMCYNGTYIVNGPSGATSYTWIGPNNFVSNNQQLTIPSIQTGMAGGYSLTVNLGPCTTSASTQVDVLTPIAFAQTPGNKVICAGDKVDLSVTSTGGSQNYAYTWNPQIYLASVTGSVQHNVQPDGTIVYNISGYDITCPNYTISTAFTITVNKAPEPVLNLAKTEGCQPLCVNLNSQTQDAVDQIVYDFGNGKSLQADNFDYCYSNPGSYTLKIRTRGKNGCNGSYTHPAPIHVWPTPHTEMNWSPDPVTTTQNEVTFEPNALYGPVVKYQWHFQGAEGTTGNDTSALRNPTRVFENVGKYPVVVISTTDKGCVDTTFKIIEVRDEFTVFIPNSFTPNGDGLNDVFNIKGLGLKAEGYSMEIYDRWGALLFSTKDALKGWDGTVKGTMAENGVYVYKVKALGANGEGKKEFVGHVSLLK